ncbi:MAG: phytanoyl-CoA dioxygenase family protein [Pseudomonadota bacterium]
MFYNADAPALDDFKAEVGQVLDPADVPLVAEVEQSIPVYDIPSLDLGTQADALRREWCWVLGDGPGVLVMKRAYTDTTALDQASAIFHDIIAAEKAGAGGGADHFAAAGANDRIWNSLQKLCMADPAVHARIFSNVALSLVCEAWLGPYYQMTAQVNLVRPSGKAQTAHRDYHLGFQTEEVALRFPAHVHKLSPVMTLQGAIAHCDMPIESGPTKLLPYSQNYGPGYLAYRHDAFRAFFEDSYVQLPLEKGDMLFFNPALFHGAGDNASEDIQRLGNLVQVSSAMGRTMESLDRAAMCKALYPVLLDGDLGLSDAERHAVIAATTEGYSFPTSLDNDPPVGGLAPKTQADIILDGLQKGAPAQDVEAMLDALENRRKP